MKVKTNDGLMIFLIISLVFCIAVLPAQAAVVSKFTPDQNLNVKITNVDATKFNKYFAYKNKPAMNSLSSALVADGNKHNMNSVFLMAVAAVESGWGGSYSARVRSNFFGYGPYWRFSSPTQCVDVVSGRIKANYLINPGYTYTVLSPTGTINGDKSYPYVSKTVTTGQYYDKTYGATVRGWIVKWNLNSQTEMSNVVSIMNDFASWHLKTYGTSITTT